jgi:hypothetical protein
LLAAIRQYPLAMCALEELQMPAPTDPERERYEARRTAQLDYNTGLKAARLEGLAEELLAQVVAARKTAGVCEPRLNQLKGRPFNPPDPSRDGP